MIVSIIWKLSNRGVALTSNEQDRSAQIRNQVTKMLVINAIKFFLFHFPVSNKDNAVFCVRPHMIVYYAKNLVPRHFIMGAQVLSEKGNMQYKKKSSGLQGFDLFPCLPHFAA